MATIVMSADKVIEAATAVISEIELKRKQENEKMIAYKIKRSIPNKFFAWFGCKPLTRDKAIDELANEFCSFFPSIRGWGDLAHAKKLLVLAKHGDPVTLNEEDTRVLF